MEILNNTPNKGRIELVNGEYYFYYNPLKYKESADIELLIKDNSIKSFRTSVSCGSCTKAKAVKTEESIKLNISYDTKNLGNIGRLVNFFATREIGKEQLYKIRLMGTVSAN